MIEDIPIKKVEDIGIALVPRLPSEEDFEDFWDCYIFNFKESRIASVLINSKGYGEVDGEMRKTSALRYYFEVIEAMDCVRVEPVPVKLLHLTNEYWVSFSHENYLFDKKYIFVKGSLEEQNFIELPFLQKRGVLIR